jgi:8-oxo-dGTP diphosphatase
VDVPGRSAVPPGWQGGVVGAERFTLPVAVQALVLDGSRVLLARRSGSGFHDGELGLPAGHVDGGEPLRSALVREVAEEVGLAVDPADARLVLTAHFAPEVPGDREYLHAFFAVRRWSGEPRIGEPDRCTELRWADVDDLPPDTVGHVAAAVAAWRSGEVLLELGW